MPTQGRRVLSSLTVRGRCVTAAAATLLLAGVLLGEQPLVQLAVFTLALPLLSAVAVARQRFRISARRVVTPARLPRGERAEVALEITNADSRSGGLWVLTEQLPAELGSPPQFVVDRLTPWTRTTQRYRVHGHRRGRYLLGPLRLRLVDPFGLVERSAVGADSASLLVVPRIRPLGAGGPAGGQGAGGAGLRRTIAVHGEDDVSTREYRHGDDLRKVHWRATARTGELMMRLEERPWRAQATLLLDTRAGAHVLAPRRRPAGAGPVTAPDAARDDDPPADSLEWVVEAAASIGTELARRGAELRAVTDTGELVPDAGHGRLRPGDLLDRLAAVGPSRVSGLAAGIDHLCRAAGDGPVICLLGAVGPDDVTDLIRRRSGPTTDLAVLADIESWVEPAPGHAERATSAAARSALAAQREDAATLLRAAGWRVAVAGADRTIAEVWAALGQPAPVATAGLEGTSA